ncbi:MAG TPA: hypothetical protein VK203_11170 [Nostocaceae cyanobacterium]|nr:hypothetical protein [Nostocaceae cyanobacterium]
MAAVCDGVYVAQPSFQDGWATAPAPAIAQHPHNRLPCWIRGAISQYPIPDDFVLEQ